MCRAVRHAVPGPEQDSMTRSAPTSPTTTRSASPGPRSSRKSRPAKVVPRVSRQRSTRVARGSADASFTVRIAPVSEVGRDHSTALRSSSALWWRRCARIVNPPAYDSNRCGRALLDGGTHQLTTGDMVTDHQQSTSITDDLKSRLRGVVLTDGDPGYDDSRTPHFGFRRGHPFAIVRPASAEDVAVAVRTAAREGLPLYVRGGGHHAAGHSTGDGLMIDLGSLDHLQVDSAERTVWADAGL